MNRRTLVIVATVLVLLGLAAFFLLPPALDALRPEPTPIPPVPTPTATPIANHTLRVQVRDAESQDPLVGADVQVEHTRGTTDGEGMYDIPVRHGASVPVVVQLAGYEPFRGEVDTTGVLEPQVTLDVSLAYNTVRGKVVGHQLVPLPGATVLYKGEAISVDGEGWFVLRQVVPGEPVTVRHPGYLEAQLLTDRFDTLYAILEPTAGSVTVHDAMMGDPIPGVSVCGQAGCQVTDAQGRAELLAAYPGLSVTAGRTGYHTAEGIYPEQGELALELQPAALHGRILDGETGEPITKAVVLVGDQIMPIDEQGFYHVENLSQAESLFVKSPGYERVTIPVRPDMKVEDWDGFVACQDPSVFPCVDIALSPFAARGLYVSYNILVWDRPHMLELIDLVDKSPILNAIVVDIKGDFGYLAFSSEDPLIASVGAFSSPRMPVDEFLQICKEKGIYTIARMVIFKDSPLVAAHPELAVRHPDGEIFYDREGMAWADPMREEVWAYNIAVTLEAIRLGFDEVQYDYLRFPSDSTSLEIVRALVYKEESTIESRTSAIAGFVKAAKAEVDRTHAFLSADIFGYALVIMPEHDMRIGQRLIDLAPHVDYLCPMIYPSTFESGNLGLVSPADNPYEVIKIAMGLAHERTDTLVRPWLQHYWYEREQIEAQKRAAEEMTDVGWCFWNARGTYDENIFEVPK